jgi:hypothetical protein
VRIERRHHYPAKVDEVVGLLTDESLVCAKCRELEQPAPDRVERSEHDDVVELRQRRRVRFPVPPGAERLLVAEPVVDSVERWGPEELDGTRRATIDLRTDGLPVSATATLALTPDEDGGGCTGELVVEFRSDLPVIGGRIADAVAVGAAELVDADHRANLSFLRRRRR